MNKFFVILMLLTYGCGVDKQIYNFDDSSVKEQIESQPIKEPSCEEQISQNFPEETSIQIPGFYLENLIYAKGSPVWFIKYPTYTEVSEDVSERRLKLETYKNKYGTLASYIKNLLPELLRDIVLSDGYIFTKDKDLAFSYYSLLRAEQLFTEEEIWIQRGVNTFYAKKEKYGYYFSSGQLKGQKVSLLLYDRVGTGSIPEPLHIDLRLVRNNLFAKTIEPINILNESLVVVLDKNLPSERKAIVGLNGTVKCQTKDIEVNESLYDGISFVNGALQSVDDVLPFDEPRNEYGLQLDGQLRGAWRSAYYRGKKSYNFNGDKYYIFNRFGQPAVPQVCVDFVVDSIERASGTWYRSSRYKRGRQVGSIDLSEYRKQYELRNTRGLTSFAKDKEEWFDVIPVNGIQMRNRDSFLNQVKELDLRLGDIVFIRGFAPWDKEREAHYHTFIISEHDPITGFPILLAGNAGPASLRPWIVEMKRAPKRYIYQIIRPKSEFFKLLNQNKEPIVVR